jgi:heme/copper-type cytochrome/quinol oxidase subunit 4
MDMPDVQPHEPAARYADSFTKYIVIYLCILALAGVQFVIAYTHLSGTAMFARMLLVALAEAGLALMFFMHLWGEKRGFVLFVLILTGFVIMAMQYGWTDSYRMELGAPYSQSKPGAVQ